jgi:hypothetical protein
MGYTTDFTGKFEFNTPLDKDTLEYLTKFSNTRRMKRKFPDDVYVPSTDTSNETLMVPKSKYGIEGEFFVDGTGDFGQDHDASIVDYNKPPSTQPSLWCGWVPSEDGKYLQWNEVEKFYEYIDWLKYLIENFIAPKNYVLNGVVHWQGEEDADIGTIQVYDNKVLVKEGVHADNLITNSIRFIKDKKILKIEHNITDK